MSAFAIAAAGYLANFAHMSAAPRAQSIRRRLYAMQKHMDWIACRGIAATPSTETIGNINRSTLPFWRSSVAQEIAA